MMGDLKTESAVVGAQSVADAVKRVADAAVAEVHKTTPVAEVEFIAHSTGKGFELVGFGGAKSFSSNGTVKLNGAQLYVREWGTTRIIGDLPADARSGEIVVHIDDKTSRRAYLKI
jgi:hypothetical protein